MTIMDDDPFEGVFDEPEANGDAEPTGDIDSEATQEPVEDAPADPEGDVPDDADDAEAEAEDVDGADEVDPEDAAEEWLIEGRFRKGEEDKVVEAYQNLESFASRRENELREQIQAEREAAFAEARKMMESQQQQKDPIQQGLERHQQMEQVKWLALQEPAEAWRVAASSGDPALMQRVVETIHTGDEELGVPGDPATAALLNRQIAEQQSRTETQRLQQDFQDFKAKMAMDNAWQQVQGQYGEILNTDNPIRQQVVEVLQAELVRDEQAIQATGQSLYDFTDPGAVRNVLEQAIDTAIGRAYRSGALTPSGEVAPAGEAPVEEQPSRGSVKKKARLESGTPNRGSRQEKPKTFAEEMADDIVNMARDSAPHLF